MKRGSIFCSLLLAGVLVFAYNSKEEEQLMFNQGYFGAVFCYQTYTNIGMIADSWVGKVYKPEQCIDLLKDQLNFLNNGQKNFKALAELNLSSNDRSVILQMISIVDDLLKEAEALKNLISTGDKKYQDNYSYYRQQAWNKIGELTKD